MGMTRFAIERNRITGVLLLVVLVSGVSAYFNMPRAEDPGFVVRQAIVLTHFPGASPARVELLVTDKLEKAIQEMPELDFVISESKTGVSIITVSILESYTEMRPIWDKLRRKIERARADLPDGVIGPIVNDEFGDIFGTIMTVVGEGFTYAELKHVADEVRDELLRIPEVAKVEIHGAQDERVFVEFNNARLAELGLSPAALQRILEARNIVIPGGQVSTGDERISLEPSGNFETVADLRQSVINLPGSREVVYLEDLATIRRGYVDPPQTMVRASGQPALALAISLRDGGNILALGEAVRDLHRQIQATYPIGIEFEFAWFQPDVVERKVNEFIVSVAQAIAIVVVVLLITLGPRTGLVVSSLIPMTIVTTFLVMGMVGVGLDQMSIAALIISLGMLVDNAIVMSESILVRMNEGTSRLLAAVESANELRIPLLTSSLTTIAAFLPIYLAESTVGEYVAPLFQVVTIALLCSWVLALTMTPLLCHRFLAVKPRTAKQTFDSPWYRRYRASLVVLLRHPWVTLGATVVIFFVVMQGFRFVPNIFFPPSDKALLLAEFTLPAGTPIERTAQIVGQLDRFLADELRVTSDEASAEGATTWTAYIGRGAPRYALTYAPEQSAPEYAITMVNTTSRDAVDGMIPLLEQFALEELPDVSAEFKPAVLGPPVNAPIEVRISGRDVDGLFEIVDRVKAQLATLGGVREIVDNWGQRTKKILVHVNQPRARRAGVSSRDIAVSLQTVLSGLETTQFREADELIPITMRSVAADRQDLGKIESLNIFSQLTGRAVPLKQVADLEVVWEPSNILRRNRLKSVAVRSQLVPGVTATSVIARLQPWLDEQQAGWDAGYGYEIGGEVEESAKSQASISAKVPIAGLIITLLLVAQFNSIRRPLIIFMTIPLGLMGVVIGLLVARSYMGFMTFLGVISLAGIVINNAIVLLDRIRIESEENGLDPAQAIIESAQRRLRPILLTTTTTIGGLLPLWLGGGPMWEPMAIAIIFGLAFATALTLGVVPVLYAVMFRVKVGPR